MEGETGTKHNQEAIQAREGGLPQGWEQSPFLEHRSEGAAFTQATTHSLPSDSKGASGCSAEAFLEHGTFTFRQIVFQVHSFTLRGGRAPEASVTMGQIPGLWWGDLSLGTSGS